MFFQGLQPETICAVTVVFSRVSILVDAAHLWAPCSWDPGAIPAGLPLGRLEIGGWWLKTERKY